VELITSFETQVFILYLSIYVIQETSVTLLEWGWINSLYLPISLLLGLPVDKIIDKLKRRQSMLLGYLIQFPVSIILIFAVGVKTVALAYILRTIAQTIQFPAIHALRTDLVPIEKRGRVFGFISVMKNVMAVPSALFFGWLYEAISPQTLFQAAAILEIFIILVIFTSFKN